MITYEEFKEMHKEPKYFNNICFVAGCNNLAEYEGGDARFYCGVCEQHSRLQERYNILINAGYYKECSTEEKITVTSQFTAD